jgi:uncharacterized membrane protein
VSVIVPGTEVAAVLLAVALLRVLQVRAFTSIQLAPTLAAIAAEGRGILDDLYRRPCTPGPPAATVLPPPHRAVAWPHGQATLQQVHVPRLLEAAGRAVIVLHIGLRALSPAVNDPATAVHVLDTMQSILSPLVVRDLDVADIADGSGAVRVILALPSWDDYLRTSLDDLIESAARSPMVLLRAHALLLTLLKTAPARRRPSISWRLEHAEDVGQGWPPTGGEPESMPGCHARFQMATSGRLGASGHQRSRCTSRPRPLRDDEFATARARLFAS